MLVLFKTEPDFPREAAESFEMFILGKRLSRVSINLNGKVVKHGSLFCSEIQRENVSNKNQANEFQLPMLQQNIVKIRTVVSLHQEDNEGKTTVLLW